MQSNLCSEIDQLLPEVRALRRELHQFPEIAFEEVETARRLLAFMGDLNGARIETGVAGTGIVVTFAADRAGPCVALRADMDALPMDEIGEQPWRSRIPGRMHACGHDGHSAMLAGAARLLATRQEELLGPVKLLFQPAEEGGGGGRVMCEAGVLRNPEVAAVFGLHNNLPTPAHKIGQIAYCRGSAMAGTGNFKIDIVGRGGHAAFPHLCIDPVFIGSAIVQQLQALVARNVDPLQAAVVSVTKFHAGSAFNIIPETATLAGTFRALDFGLLQHLCQRIPAIAQQVAAAHGAEVQIKCSAGYPPVINHPDAIRVFEQILAETGDITRWHEVAPIMGGEDFAFFSNEVPGLFYFLPSCPEDQTEVPMCHHPAFDFNDDLLATGMRLHLQTALRFAHHWPA